VPHPRHALYAVQFVTAVVETHIGDPTSHTGIRKLLFGQGVVEAPCPQKLLEVRQAHNLDQRARRKLSIVGTSYSTHSTKVAIFQILPELT
jgi:hypothetical protein